jgi:hypothetical protein
MTSLIVDEALCAECVSIRACVAVPIARAVLTSLAKSGHVVTQLRLCRCKLARARDVHPRRRQVARDRAIQWADNVGRYLIGPVPRGQRQAQLRGLRAHRGLQPPPRATVSVSRASSGVNVATAPGRRPWLSDDDASGGFEASPRRRPYRDSATEPGISARHATPGRRTSPQPRRSWPQPRSAGRPRPGHGDDPAHRHS